MTVRESIRQADELRPNTISDATKRRWLAQLDGLLRRQVLAQTADTVTENTGADKSTTDDTPLLAQAPYDALYLYWLTAQTDLALGELVRYGNDMALYNTALAEYAAACRTAHVPCCRGQFRL